MMKKFKLGACLPAFGSCADRYCLSGYGKGGKTMKEMLDMAAQVKELDGLELVSNWHINDANLDSVKKLFAERNLKVCMVVPDLWTQAKWGGGSLASPDRKIRKAAVMEVKRSMDWAAGVGCRYVDVWPGQDGYDYPFQSDFRNAWQWLREGIKECASHRSDVKVLVEYKLKEPRTHCFVNSAAKDILLIQGLKNAGVLLDVGHSLAAGENWSEAASLLSGYGMLDYLHLNDNYGSWDDDMLVAAVHIPEYLELIYWIQKLNYSGWLTLDIFPYREEKIPAVKNCFAWLKALFAMVAKTGPDNIEKVVQKGDANEASRLVRRMLTGNGDKPR